MLQLVNSKYVPTDGFFGFRILQNSISALPTILVGWWGGYPSPFSTPQRLRRQQVGAFGSSHGWPVVTTLLRACRTLFHMLRESH